MRAQRIVIIGSGAVATVLAAAAQHAGQHVIMCVRTPVDQLELETPDGAELLAPEVHTNPADVPAADWVLLTTKVQDTPRTEPWLRAFDSVDVPIAVVQNGVEHHRSVAEFGLRNPILPALIYVAAERTRPGQVHRRSTPSMIVPTGELGRGFQHLFTNTEMQLSETTDFRTAAWRKMLINVAANPITALTLRRLDVFDDRQVRELATRVLVEAVQVARAEGADLDHHDVDRVVDNYTANFSATNGTSMLYDRLAGLPTEHEHITGPVVEAAHQHEISVPHNEMLLTLLRCLRPAQPADGASD